MKALRTLSALALGALLLPAGCTLLLDTEELLTFCASQAECEDGFSCEGGVCLPGTPSATDAGPGGPVDGGDDDDAGLIEDDAGPIEDDAGPIEDDAGPVDAGLEDAGLEDDGGFDGGFDAGLDDDAGLGDDAGDAG